LEHVYYSFAFQLEENSTVLIDAVQPSLFLYALAIDSIFGAQLSILSTSSRSVCYLLNVLRVLREEIDTRVSVSH
jgi:hypothetical protein